jgi:hypothetical protein
VINPPEIWVRRDGSFEPIVSHELFAKAQKRMIALGFGRVLSDQELLAKLADLYRRKGYLSIRLMMVTKGMPNVKTYVVRFGSIAEAFRRVGFELKPYHRFKENHEKADRIICSVAQDLMSHVESRGRSVAFLHELYLLTISNVVTVSLTIARPNMRGGGRVSWDTKRIRYQNSDLSLIVRMNAANDGIMDYFLLPTSVLPRPKDGRFAISKRCFIPFRYDSFGDVLSALHQRLNVAAPKIALAGGLPVPDMEAASSVVRERQLNAPAGRKTRRSAASAKKAIRKIGNGRRRREKRLAPRK